jgi:hypothetical protein
MLANVPKDAKVNLRRTLADTKRRSGLCRCAREADVVVATRLVTSSGHRPGEDTPDWLILILKHAFKTSSLLPISAFLAAFDLAYGYLRELFFKN